MRQKSVFGNLNQWELLAWLWNFPTPPLFKTYQADQISLAYGIYVQEIDFCKPTITIRLSLSLAVFEEKSIPSYEMKILNWVQSKLIGRHSSKKRYPISANWCQQEPQKEEFSDWPHGLLAIGTLGKTDVKEDPERHNLQGNLPSFQEHPQDLTPEEVGQLHKELKSLFHKQLSAEHDSTPELDNPHLPPYKILDIHKENSDKPTDDLKQKDGHLQCSSSLVISREKNVYLDNSKRAMGKKSLSFLLVIKKMFVCTSSFSPTYSLRDPVPESRMDKILRLLLHKKIYPQSSSSTLSIMKYLENRHMAKSENKDEVDEKPTEGSKWVKTDSEYIVLEI